jgi:hypothetical protein
MDIRAYGSIDITGAGLKRVFNPAADYTYY